MKQFIQIMKVFKPLLRKVLISMVSRPTSMGGLGFGMKWMMGWMHDTLEYFQKRPSTENTTK
jgi:1,4-alpha-glucan branching enzyme